jgi:hypothetical protein
MYDLNSGRPVGEQPFYTHHSDIVHLAVEQSNVIFRPRLLAILDVNSDLHILTASVVSSKSTKHDSAPVSSAMCKLMSHHAETFSWNSETNAIAYIAEGKLSICYEPAALFYEDDLVSLVTDTSGSANI